MHLLQILDKKATQRQKSSYMSEKTHWYIHYWRKPLNGVSSYKKLRLYRDIDEYIRLGLPTKQLQLDNGKEKWIIKK